MNKIIKIFFLTFIFQIPLSILSYIFPKKNILLFSAKNGLFKGNSKYLFLYSNEINIKNYKYYYTTNDNKTYEEIIKLQLPVIKKYSFKGFYYLLISKYLFIDTGIEDISYSYVIFGKFNIIQTWHGTSIKKIALEFNKNKIIKLFYKFNYGKYKAILATSKSNENLMRKSFLNDNIIITGLPRNDIFFKKNNKFKNNFKKNFSKVITYAPTFRDNQNIKPFTSKFLIQLNKYLKSKNIVFYLKLHINDKSILINNKLENIIFVDKSTDLQELLIYSDLLITDYSSCFIDFMITKKPIIFYSYDYKNYLNNCRDLYVDYFEDLPGPFVKNENELINIINNIEIWFNKDYYQKKYTAFNDKYNLYKDGNSCKRVFEYLEIN